MKTNLQAIVLAAGKSSNFNSPKTKLVEKICGQELVLYPIKLLESMAISTTVVIGYQKELVQQAIAKSVAKNIQFVVQEEQHGTAHAIACTKENLKNDHLLIMNADMPLVTQEIIEKLYAKHIQTNATVSFVIAHNDQPSGFNYSRVIQKENDIQVVKAHYLKDELHDHCCIDAGIYIVTKKFLEENISQIEKDEATKQFYFTDIIKIASQQGQPITTIATSFDRIRGINNYQELWAAEHIKRSELIKYWMDQGVRFSVAQNVHIDLDVKIGAGTYIGCAVHIENGSKIGKNCHIHEFTTISGAHLEDNVTVYSHSVIKDSHIQQGAQVGPFAHIRKESTIQNNAVVGNFVEISQSTIGQQSKAKHLSYIGNAEIGSHVNIGAGTITCNYDGKNKHTTTIKDNVFIGSNNTLVAPITIEKNAYTAAGSTLTHNVNEDALALGRARQITKEGYARKLRGQAEGAKQEEASYVAAVKSTNDTTFSEGA